MTGDELKIRLDAIGMTLKEFSDEVGVPLRTLYGYTSGTRRMPQWMEFVLERLEADKHV